MIFLKEADGGLIDLQDCPEFYEHSKVATNYATFIVDEINIGHLYDIFFPYIRNGVILDIGANVGIFTMHIKSIAKQIYSIEPTPSHFTILSSVLKAFDVTNVIPCQCAISKTTGEMNLYMYDGNSTMNGLMQYSAINQSIAIKAYSLKDFMDTNGISIVDFIKLDVEGSEKDIFEDETLLSLSERIRSIYVEIHPYPPFNAEYSRIADILKSMKYELQTFEKDNHIHAVFACK